MPTSAIDAPSKRRPTAETALGVVSAALALGGVVALGLLGEAAELDTWAIRLIGGTPWLPVARVTSAARWGVLDAAFVVVGSAAALAYRSKRLPSLRYGALATWSLAMTISGCLVAYGIHVLTSRPAGGDFGGLVNFGMAIVYLVLPGAAGLITLLAVRCLIVVRARSDGQSPQPRPGA